MGRGVPATVFLLDTPAEIKSNLNDAESAPVKSVSINFSTFVDAAGVTAKIDGTACPSISTLEARPICALEARPAKVVKVILEE